MAYNHFAALGNKPPYDTYLVNSDILINRFSGFSILWNLFNAMHLTLNIILCI